MKRALSIGLALLFLASLAQAQAAPLYPIVTCETFPHVGVDKDGFLVRQNMYKRFELTAPTQKAELEKMVSGNRYEFARLDFDLRSYPDTLKKYPSPARHDCVALVAAREDGSEEVMLQVKARYEPDIASNDTSTTAGKLMVEIGGPLLGATQTIKLGKNPNDWGPITAVVGENAVLLVQGFWPTSSSQFNGRETWVKLVLQGFTPTTPDGTRLKELIGGAAVAPLPPGGTPTPPAGGTPAAGPGTAPAGETIDFPIACTVNPNVVADSMNYKVREHAFKLFDFSFNKAHLQKLVTGTETLSVSPGDILKFDLLLASGTPAGAPLHDCVAYVVRRDDGTFDVLLQAKAEELETSMGMKRIQLTVAGKLVGNPLSTIVQVEPSPSETTTPTGVKVKWEDLFYSWFTSSDGELLIQPKSPIGVSGGAQPLRPSEMKWVTHSLNASDASIQLLVRQNTEPNGPETWFSAAVKFAPTTEAGKAYQTEMLGLLGATPPGGAATPDDITRGSGEELLRILNAPVPECKTIEQCLALIAQKFVSQLFAG